MNILINGHNQNLKQEIVFLKDLISELNLQARRIAVEINGEIISRSLFESTMLKANDRVEIIKAVGGG